MATIQSSIKLFDGFSPIIKNMIKTNQNIISSLYSVHTATDNAFDPSAIQAAQDALAQVKTGFDDVEKQIKGADEQQKKLTENIKKGEASSKSLLSTFGKIAATIGAALGVKKVIQLSDEMTMTTARLNMMNDGLQTTEELQGKIFASAQRSRAEYQTTADMVAKLGTQAKDAFSSNDELIAFSEALNKSFAIAGADGQAVESVMYNLTQALSSGVLRGQDLNAVFSNAPNIVQKIADYLDVPVGQIRDMAADGELSASVIKNAMLSSLDDINAEFDAMPRTFGQVWTSIKNTALKQFTPVLNKINEIANNPRFQRGVDSMIAAITVLADVALRTFEIIGNVASWIGDNWSLIAPIVFGVVAAFIAYNSVAWITAAATAAITAAKYAYVFILSIFNATAAAATAAQWGLNAAMYANPIGIIIALVIALIVVFVIFAEQIVGAWSWFSALLRNVGLWIANVGLGIRNVIVNVGLWFANLGLGIWEVLKACASNVGAAFHNAWIGIQIGFWSVVDVILQGVKKIIEAVNLIPGVEIATSGLDFAKNKANELKNSYKDFESIGDAWDKGFNTHEYNGGFSEGFDTFDVFQDGWGSEAYDAGAKVGAGIHDTVMSVLDIFKTDDFQDDLADFMKQIQADTGDISDTLEYSEEDLRYMRDIAERDAVNRYTTAEIRIEQHNENHISSGADLDGVIAYLNDGVAEAVEIATEGDHE